MTEQDSKEKYVKRSRCKMKYHNNDDSTKEHFRCNRLGEQLKTCTTCREKRTQYYKDYYIENKEYILESSKTYHQEHKEERHERWKENNLHKDELNKTVVCDNCGKEVSKKKILRHQSSGICKMLGNGD